MRAPTHSGSLVPRLSFPCPRVAFPFRLGGPSRSCGMVGSLRLGTCSTQPTTEAHSMAPTVRPRSTVGQTATSTVFWTTPHVFLSSAMCTTHHARAGWYGRFLYSTEFGLLLAPGLFDVDWFLQSDVWPMHGFRPEGRERSHHCWHLRSTAWTATVPTAKRM